MIIDKKQEKLDLEPMPAPLLAEMFKSGIVIFPEAFDQQVAEEPGGMVTEEKIGLATMPGISQKELPNPAAISWLGNFFQKILVVVNDPTSLHLNDEDFALLTKIMTALHLTVADIALVNAARQNLQYENLNEKLPAKVALYFGVEPVTIGVPFKIPMFQAQLWNQTTFICAPSLKELNKETVDVLDMKKTLWTTLKKVFL